MFLIRNQTDRDVVINDLRVILGPHKQIDLDKVAARHQIESSHKLRMAFRDNRILLVTNDAVEHPTTASEEALQLMEERLKLDFRRQLLALKEAQPIETESSAQAKIDELTDTVKLLVEQLKNQQANIPHVSVSVQESGGSTDDGISDDIASKIHAKNMQRIEKKMTGSHVETESKTIQDDNFKKNVDELEGLL